MSCGIENVKLKPSKVYWGGEDLGLIQGDIELTTEDQAVDITAHQSGTEVLGAIRTGKNVSLTTVLLETSAAKITNLLKASGTTATAQAEISTVTCVADVSNSLDGKYFTFKSGANLPFYAWINTSGGSATDPAPGGTGITVNVTTGDTAAAVATAVASAINADAAFNATSSGAVVTITNAVAGGADDIDEGDSGFTVAVTQQGNGAVTGWGSSTNFGALTDGAKALWLHPVAKSDTDYTEDFTFHLAFPQIDSITLSGENPATVSITWRIFRDCTRNTGIDYFMFGARY